MVKVLDFEIMEYKPVLLRQEEYFNHLIRSKKNLGVGEEYILIGEHPSVITMGRRAKKENILISAPELKERGIEIFQVGRGGDVTFHCEGQIILYPIIDLEKHGVSVKEYVSILEESVIRTLQKYGIKGERVEGATGVWVGKDSNDERKICAIGVKCSHFCTMHGLALNVNSDLSGFTLINPCGFIDKGVTSMEKETGYQLNIKEVKRELLITFLSLMFPFEEILHLLE